jgi:hypothetical protein
MDIENIILEKMGEFSLRRAKILADSKFGDKIKLKIKFYQSILDGYVNIDKEWDDKSTISLISSRLSSATEEEKRDILSNIMDVYASNPKLKSIISKYKKFIN